MNDNNNNKDKYKNILRTIINTVLIIGIVLALAFGAYLIYSNNKQNSEDDKKLSYTDLVKEIEAGNVEKIEMTFGSATLKVKLKDEEEEKTTIISSTQAFTELVQEKALEEKGVTLEIKKPSIISQVPSYIMSVLPTVIMLALFIMIFKMQGLGDKGEVYDDTERKTKITFDDIAGLDEEKEELKEIVEFLKQPKKFTEMGAKIPKGVLLYGKPGTGKTLIAKAIAGEADVPFISMSGSEFIEMFAGL